MNPKTAREGLSAGRLGMSCQTRKAVAIARRTRAGIQSFFRVNWTVICREVMGFRTGRGVVVLGSDVSSAANPAASSSAL